MHEVRCCLVAIGYSDLTILVLGLDFCLRDRPEDRERHLPGRGRSLRAVTYINHPQVD